LHLISRLKQLRLRGIKTALDAVRARYVKYSKEWDWNCKKRDFVLMICKMARHKWFLHHSLEFRAGLNRAMGVTETDFRLLHHALLDILTYYSDYFEATPPEYNFLKAVVWSCW
tara:strand:- start:5594 stop:5935 length:342 start_codon:yes stop_codon:yes gene_type:complete